MRKREGCDYEERVVDARRAGRHDAELAGHVASCDTCRELVDVIDFVETLAAIPVDQHHRLPEPGRVWWRAQLVRRWQAERRAAHQLDRMYPLEAGILAASIILFVVLSWPVVERWISATELGGATLLAASLLPAGMVSALVGGGVLLTIVTLVMMRDLMEG